MKTAFLMALAVFIGLMCAPEMSAQDGPYGLDNLRTSEDGRRYRQSWAVIIGINYEGRQNDLETYADRIALPQLKNAVADAERLSKVLKEYYGYEDDHIVLLTEENAKKDPIETAIGNLLNTARVDARDSVLVFFSGHGVRLDDANDRAAILPYDVQLSNGRPTAKYLGIHTDVFNQLQKCPAEHKLVILDSCYSGEIFNVGFQPRSEAEDRSRESLFNEKAFQALASCRATQVASDGSGPNSPFTEALVDGLLRLPAQGERLPEFIYLNRVFSFMQPRLADLVSGQEPLCHNLVNNDGEFWFLPDPTANFSKYRVSVEEQNMLRAMIASRQGNWWFEEIPWFMPSVREHVIREHEKLLENNRSNAFARYISPEQLQRSAEQALDKMEAQDRNAFRREHFKLLMESHGTPSFKKRLEQIATALESQYSRRVDDATKSVPPAKTGMPGKLEAVDVHFLAILHHALNRDAEAKNTYKDAIELYEGTVEDNPAQRTLMALCHADFGVLLLDHLDSPKEAAEQFNKASQEVHRVAGGDSAKLDAAITFRIFVQCREASAWLRLNNWSEANKRLDRANHLANVLGANDFLGAFVHKQRAWAEMIQWKISDAQGSFARSNEILVEVLRSSSESDLQEADSTETTQVVSDLAEVASRRPSLEEDPFAIDEVIRTSSDFESRITYLHNLHGLSMAKRFKGDASGAAEMYRRLTAEVEDTLTSLKTAAGRTGPQVHTHLIGRVINTQERLGDCNLFGDPITRDLKEAVDDYRRALNRVHLLPANQRDRWNAVLLYKQSLALSLVSPVQDLDLAKEMCRRACEIYESKDAPATGLYLALGELTPKVVSIISEEDKANLGDASAHAAAVSSLRDAIRQFRDTVGTRPHRDQLELCLFASRVLLEHGGNQSRYQILEDADLLISFCRIALDEYHAPSHFDGQATAGSSAESRAYLRPYYDAAMRAKMAVQPKHVKDLLEIQREATGGFYHIKTPKSVPVLAIYVLDDEGFLLVDLPLAESKCVPLAGKYDVRTIREACYSEEPLDLPREVTRYLVEWQQDNEELDLIASPDTRWIDPIRDFPQSLIAADSRDGGDERVALKPNGRFPFKLPDGFGSP